MDLEKRWFRLDWGFFNESREGWEGLRKMVEVDVIKFSF